MNVPVIGNGTTLGLTNGSLNVGLQGYVSSTIAFLTNNTSLYGTSIGTSVGSGGPVTNSVGITTDPTKSGIIAKFSGLTLGTVNSKKLGNFYIRY